MIGKRQLSLTIPVVILGLSTVSVVGGMSQASVYEQLVALQKETGLTLATFGFAQNITVDFARREIVSRRWKEAPTGPSRAQGGTVSPDLSEVAVSWLESPNRRTLRIVRSDGTLVREYGEIGEPSSTVCWSGDNTAIALNTTVREGGELRSRLVLLNLPSGAITEIGPAANLTTQCWSPDGKQLVYSVVDWSAEARQRGTVFVFDVRTKKSRELGRGAYPSWSPDGRWIALLDSGEYDIVRPTGADRQVLFRAKHAEMGLLWSPDSKFVAYPLRYFPAFVSGYYLRIRVRRLADNSDDWVVKGLDGEETANMRWFPGDLWSKRTPGK
jgi:hypothetical protein